MPKKALTLAKPATPNPTPMDLIRIAVDQNADVEKLTKLYELQQRWEADQAKKAYDVALADFKADPPTLFKKKTANYGTGENQVNYTWAPLEHICEEIGKTLSKHGLSHRWSITQVSGVIRVSCVLTHVGGHSESVALEGLADSSGKKNAVQAIGSTVSYLERYTLLAITGLAAKGMDDDGKSAGAPKETGSVPVNKAKSETTIKGNSSDIKESKEPNRGHGADNLDGLNPKERQERIQRTGSINMMNDIIENLWADDTTKKYREIAGRELFGVTKRIELNTLPLDVLQRGISALKIFESNRKKFPMPITEKNLIAELQVCLMAVDKKTRPQLVKNGTQQSEFELI